MAQDVPAGEQNPQQWEQVPQVHSDVAVNSAPDRPESVRLEIEGVLYDRVPDTGWTMLLAWLAGPNHLVRTADREQHTVRVTSVKGDITTITSEPRTQADQDVIDDGIDEYLADANVPSPPRGFRWHQRIPEGYDSLDDAYGYINRVLRDSDPDGAATRPDQLAPLVATAVANLYPR